MVFALVYLGAAFLGVAIARTPLARPGYWARLGVLTALIAGLIFLPPALDAMFPPGPEPFGPGVLLLLVTGLFLLPASVFLAFLWQARRMIDASGSRWWALLGVIPGAFLVFGALRSQPANGLSEDSAAAVFR